jgi:hypothetical protein
MHRGQDELSGQHDRAQVQVEGLLPLHWIRRREARFLDAPGVVDQHGDRTDRVDRRADVGRVGEVGAEERAAGPFGHNRARPFVEVGDDHVHALRGEPFRDPGADPGRTSRHQSGQPVEFHGGIVWRGTDNSAKQALAPTGLSGRGRRTRTGRTQRCTRFALKAVRAMGWS